MYEIYIILEIIFPDMSTVAMDTNMIHSGGNSRTALVNGECGVGVPSASAPNDATDGKFLGMWHTVRLA